MAKQQIVPMLAERHESNWRAAPWWVMVLVLVPALPIGVFAWGFFQPVRITLGTLTLRLSNFPIILKYNGPSPPKCGIATLPLPFEMGHYFVSWELKPN